MMCGDPRVCPYVGLAGIVPAATVLVYLGWSIHRVRTGRMKIVRAEKMLPFVGAALVISVVLLFISFVQAFSR